jgi:hypothetical protein
MIKVLKRTADAHGVGRKANVPRVQNGKVLKRTADAHGVGRKANVPRVQNGLLRASARPRATSVELRQTGGNNS